MCVDINEYKFEGAGKTKKLARMEAAQKAVDFLLKNPEFIQKPTKSTQPGTSASVSAESASANDEGSKLSSGQDQDAITNEISTQAEGEDDDDDESESLDENEDSSVAKKFKN